MKKLWLCLLNFFSIPFKRRKYGLAISEVKTDTLGKYVDVSYVTRVNIDDVYLTELRKLNYPLNLVLADDFRKELDSYNLVRFIQ